ncbi:molybdopterin molybdenumtransferase [Variibacter gotjawalensis]|uniref:Molybdopterin molybdenumtransferase n=1 Tax=Variibacter gotjawalensis TaxID=1333996 RepID=A0A0S3PWR8_9BRAD|nr:gephyrin-like molybdotransferase Glp [Variibacter gotjawalensis]NIK46216.1 molybdopterin molybdotransferase [Variibacter gotjawalensis]RZS48132.1 molybdopterin molybdochelatase [Variibacter gotjawalensis]BAT60389.1 molybdopterin molybdenumtransferase [Variibacter gotjawalensis]
MAQLSDDCFAFGGKLMSIDDVERLMLERISPIDGQSTVKLAAARGRVLARDLIATVDLPPFANSAVDGYAVRHGDLSSDGGTRLRVAERLTAGTEPTSPVLPGTAVRVFTGAPMPEGADTVFMQEDVAYENGAVILPPGLKRGANSRAAGEDIAKGAIALAAGTRLGPSELAMAAAIGRTDLRVRKRVRVALFSTGDEVQDAGEPLRKAKVYDANRPLVKALLENFGARVTDLGILKDDPAELSEALKNAAADHDLIITSGGVSAGEADFVRPVLESVGSLVFWRVAIKPGRPVAMGVVPSSNAHNAAFVGLPGNPVAVFVTFARVVRPLLLRLAGANAEPLVAFPVRSTFAYKKKKDRREYIRVKVARSAAGVLEATIHPQAGAGIISSLTETDGLGELLEDVTRVDPGDDIGFIPYASLLA